MKARTGDGFPSSRYAVLFLALAALAAAVSFAASSVAHAQEEQERLGLLNRLFGSKPAYRIEDPPADVGRPRAARTQPKVERPQKKKPRVQRDGAEPPQVAVIAKRPDARVVLVVGDFLGSGLAEGLTTAFTQSPDVRIVDRTSGSSGFVREDFHNWPEKVGALIASERPAAIVVMIGANDRQQMLVGGVRETVRSESWNKEYAARAESLAKAISARKVPFLWVGMPPFKSSKTMLDMLAFNDIYRAAATGAGGEFVDIWDGFVDENGAYMSNGPDLNGQPSRLRAADGINLARPGKRKVAFYVEKPLYKLLGQDPAAPAVASTSTRSPYRLMGPFGPVEPQEPSDVDVVVDANEVGPIDPARPILLRTPALDGGVELLGMVAEPRHDAQTPAEKLAIEGIAPAPVAGRADQFASPLLASAATAMRQLNIDRTLSKVKAPSVLPDPPADRAEFRSVLSDVLRKPRPQAPPAATPAIQPDRLEEISPTQAAPAVAAAPPPLLTPATIDRAAVPAFAVGDPRDLSPLRGAPLQAYKRPKSIGPEPNRAPTAVPKSVEEIFAPAAAEEEVPSSANPDGSPDATADAEWALPDTAPALPDSAPARAPAPSFIPGIAEDTAPARIAPRKAEPVPVASLPVAKDAPSELLPAQEAPKTAAVPNMPLEPEAGIVAARAAPSIEPAEITGSAPARAAPAAEPTAVLDTPARIAPSTVLTETAPTANTPAAAALPALKPASAAPVISPADGGSPSARPIPEGLQQQAIPAEVAPATPVAPAAPSALPKQAAAPASPAASGETPAATGLPEVAQPPVQPIMPATPPSPAPPTVLPENAATPPPAFPGKEAALTGQPTGQPAAAQP
ncbi:DUF459 domain-containing protein [Mesorhizobium sp. KR9-304]|uniref:SGNH/GDSL hydrolase family protein n=1 Tax=Mesorhizobium sp. KR9-304 TaxID=3156614 RepID=UPI0032B4BB86